MEFQYQLSVTDTLLQQHHGCHVLVGGDFNVDFSRNWNNTLVLNTFSRFDTIPECDRLQICFQLVIMNAVKWIIHIIFV